MAQTRTHGNFNNCDERGQELSHFTLSKAVHAIIVSWRFLGLIGWYSINYSSRNIYEQGTVNYVIY